MSPDTHEPRVPDIVLERYRLDELPHEEAQALSVRLRQDAALRQRLEALDRSDEEIRRVHPPEWLADRVIERLHSRAPERSAPRRRAAYWAVPAAVAATLLAAVVVVPRIGDSIGTSATGPDEDRIKGLRPALTLYRKTADGSETLADGTVAHAGDLIRIGYRAAGRAYGVILSLDGRGAVTRHLPTEGDRAAALGREATVLLDSAYELDDAPRWEQFYFVTGEEPFAVAPIVEAARRAAAAPGGPAAPALALPRGLDQSIISLQKEARP